MSRRVSGLASMFAGAPTFTSAVRCGGAMMTRGESAADEGGIDLAACCGTFQQPFAWLQEKDMEITAGF